MTTIMKSVSNVGIAENKKHDSKTSSSKSNKLNSDNVFSIDSRNQTQNQNYNKKTKTTTATDNNISFNNESFRYDDDDTIEKNTDSARRPLNKCSYRLAQENNINTISDYVTLSNATVLASVQDGNGGGGRRSSAISVGHLDVVRTTTQFDNNNFIDYSASANNIEYAAKYMRGAKSSNKEFLSNLKFLNSRKKKIAFVIGVILLTLILVVAVALIVIAGIVPCSLTKCNSRASVCINHAFYAECVCDYGYVGDGKAYCDECGVSYNMQNSRVVGGITAVAHSWPAAALIISNYKADLTLGTAPVTIDVNFMCGGTLINRRSVLTAAHCVVKSFDYVYNGETYSLTVSTNKYYPTYESMYKVYLGIQNKSSITNGMLKPGQLQLVDKITINEAFDRTNIINDVAVLRLKNAVELNTDIQVACLPDPKWDAYPPQDSEAWILGWGTLSEGGSTPDALQNLNITVLGGPLCNNVVAEDQKDWESQICAGDYFRGGRDTCQGDSGGGLYSRGYVNGYLKHIISGIVSYGEGCGYPKKPG